MTLNDYGVRVGNPTDFVILYCRGSASAISEIAQLPAGLNVKNKPFRIPQPGYFSLGFRQFLVFRQTEILSY